MRNSVLVLFLALAACNDPGVDETDTQLPDGPTYWADVRPIIDESCARCHVDGGLAPISFDKSEKVVEYAIEILGKIDAGEMPPPAPDPACADYEDSDRFVLDETEKQVFHDWVNTGMQMGNEADRPEPAPLLTLEPWDQVIRGVEPYQPKFSAGELNDYRCWAIDVGNENEIYLTGLEALVDHLSFVHHVVLFDDGENLLGGNDGWSGGADPNDPDGFSCGGFGEGDWQFVHGWGPGSRPMDFPEGYGLKLQANAKLVIQAHYFDAEDEEEVPDSVGYGLLLADQVATEVYNIPVFPQNFDYIPAGDGDYHAKDDFDLSFIPIDITVLSVWPHMHVLGVGYDYTINREDGSETCLVHQDAWDFHNQVPVQYIDPIVVSPGDTVTIDCHYDNSTENPNQFYDPPQNVYFGEGTTDEMCFGFTYAVLGDHSN